MFGEKDLSNGQSHHHHHHHVSIASEEGSQSKLTRVRSPLTQNQFNPDEKIASLVKGMDLFKDSRMGLNWVESRPSRTGNSSSQELSLNYLMGTKGKEIVSPEDEDKWVERDFLNLGRIPSRKEVEEQEIERENCNREKRQKLETLNLSLAPPDVSLSLTASIVLQKAVQSQTLEPVPAPSPPPPPVPSTTNNTQTTCSNDFTAPSMSYSYSHPFSHNPSCSLTRNSTENYDDPIWYGGEGTNGSVHSRFKTIGDGSVALANASLGGGGSNSFLMQSSSFYKPSNSSDNHSYFLPSELPACPRKDTVSGDSRRTSDHVRGLEVIAGGRTRRVWVPGPERLLSEIVSMSIPIMAQTIRELPDEAIESAKDYLKNLIGAPERREELVVLQSRLDKRSDITKETLIKCHKDQLDMIVAVRTGLGDFISPKNRLPTTELEEIVLFMRCRNVNCKSLLPIDDCECKICSENKGFCSTCMCPICLNFDCAVKTCSWVGCDVCDHWCHASCGIRRNLIRPGPSLKGPMGTTEMQFHCLGCGHASEMLGFVKDVFTCCAKDWVLETLIKELGCVRKIFKSSEDFKGKQLHLKAEELLSKLEVKSISPSDACSLIIKFFNSIESMAEIYVPTISSREGRFNAGSFSQDVAALLQPSFMRSSSEVMSDLHKKGFQASLIRSEVKSEDELGRMSKEDMFDSLESIIRIKEVEARMFQNKADEARREAEAYRDMICIRTEKLEEEYAQRLAELCLQETEEKRKKKLEELKVLENSHCDYQKMKMRMQAEIAGLLEKMKAA